jgi:hypothetical protein
LLKEVAKVNHIDLNKKYGDLTQKERETVLY